MVSQLVSGNSCKYEIYYHIVFCPKYRKPILTKEVKDWLKNSIPIICESKEWKIISLEIMPDHIHIFISSHPKESPTGIVKILKGVTALRLFKQFPKLKQEYWNGHIWSSGYYVGTAGSVTKDSIKKYIEENSSNQ